MKSSPLQAQATASLFMQLQFLLLFSMFTASSSGSFVLPRRPEVGSLRELADELESRPYFVDPNFAPNLHDSENTLVEIAKPSSPFLMPKMEKREQAMRICGIKLTKFIIETCGLVVPKDMKPVKIVEKRSFVHAIMDKRSLEKMQIVRMCCTHRCTASAVRQHVCAKPEEMQQIMGMMGNKRSARYVPY